MAWYVVHSMSRNRAYSGGNESPWFWGCFLTGLIGPFVVLLIVLKIAGYI